MSIRRNRLGFTALELVLALVIVGLIGLVGYKIYNTQKENDKITNNTEAVLEQTPTVTNTAVPAAINSTSDLEQAEKALADYDSSASDDRDLTQLDSQLSAF